MLTRVEHETSFKTLVPGLLQYLETSTFPHSQSSHPHVIEEYLTAGVGYKLAMVGGHAEAETGLVAEVLQFVRQ